MMTSHVPTPLTFTLLDSTGDAPFVLVLVEATNVILNYWQDIQTYYLPFLLDALGAGSKDRPVRVCWQLTSDSPAYSSIETQGQIPDFQFSPTANAPITLAALRRGLETIKSAPREQGWTRHLIIIAVSPPLPSEVAGNPREPGMLSETHQAMAEALAEERIRMHMVLSAGQYMQPLRDLHNLLLRHQYSSAIPPWFQYDSAKYTIHLSPQPLLHDSTMERRTRVALLTPHGNVSAAPATTSPPLPLLSPAHETSSHALTPSPPSRRTRLKTKDSTSPPSPPASSSPGGLVSFLQKAHGLSKKRASSAKITKRSSVSEQSRSSTSSRPILPKLTLPQHASLAVRPIDTNSRIAAQFEVASAIPAPASVTAYVATASVSGSASAPRDGGSTPGQEGYPPGRWPFLKLMPMTMAHEGPGFSESANAALRSLDALSPRSPAAGMRLTGEYIPGYQSSADMYVNAPRTDAPNGQYGQYGAYGTASSSHNNTISMGYSTTASGYPMSSSNPTYAAPIPHGSGVPHENVDSHEATPQHQASPTAQRQTYSSSLGHDSMQRTSPISQHAAHMGYPHGTYGYQQMVSVNPYGMSPTGSQGSTPLPSPSITGAIGTVDEGEDQPFVVTPEYEAFANARFEAALRSGTIQASMTPAALSPNIVSALNNPGSNEYFGGQVAPKSDHIASGSGLQQVPMLSQHEYASYPGTQQQHNMQGHSMYQQQLEHGTMSDPGSSHYYHTAGTEAPGQPWYGP